MPFFCDIIKAERNRIKDYFNPSMPDLEIKSSNNAKTYTSLVNSALDKSVTEARKHIDALDLGIGFGVVLLAGAVAAKIIAPTQK